MDKDKKVIQFNQDDEFYFELGKKYLQNGELVKSIRSMHTAISKITVRNEILLSSYHLVLAQAYSMVNNLELSNYYYYLCLNDGDLFAQFAFRGLGENFALQKDYMMARFYLNQCINIMENSQLADSAKQKLKQIGKGNTKGFKIVGQEDKLLQEKKLAQAENYMSKGKFEKAIDVLEKIGDYTDQRVRAELALAYFFTNESQKGVELIKTFGEDNILDLCNLLLIYFVEEDKENYAKIKEKLRSYKVEKEEDNFKIGLAFAQTDELTLAKLYMEKFLSQAKHEPELEFLYCLACINNKDYDIAKNKLLDLKSLDPFNNYVFDYYLNMCETKPDQKVEYLFNLPMNKFLEVQNQVKQFLVKKDEDLKQDFLNNKDLFYFIANLPESNVKSLLLLKLAKIECKELNDFFNYILLQNGVKPKLKENLALSRLSLDKVTSISLTRDNFFTKLIIPNKKATKLKSEKLNKATLNCCEFLLTKTATMKINIKNKVIYIERKELPEDEIDENVLSAYLTWTVVSVNKLATLNDVCLYFSVTQAQFYDFIKKYQLADYMQ